MAFPDGTVLDIEPSPGIVETTVKQGIAVAFKILQTPKFGKKRIFEDTEEKHFKLTLEVYRIPPIHHQKNKIIRIRLRHSPIPSTSGVCLFAQDLQKKGRPDNEKAVVMYKDILKLKGVEGITRVITLDQLRKEYKTHESKRQLCHCDDVFISDDTIAAFLPRLLGREFWTKKKVPTKVNMKSKNLKEEFQKVMKTVNLIVHGRGPTYSVSIGYLGLGQQKIWENFKKVCQALKQSLPGGWPNVKSIHLSLGNSIDLPLFFNDGSGGDVKIPIAVTETKRTGAQELTTLSKRVKVHPRGNVRITRKRC